MFNVHLYTDFSLNYEVLLIKFVSIQFLLSLTLSVYLYFSPEILDQIFLDIWEIKEAPNKYFFTIISFLT